MGLWLWRAHPVEHLVDALGDRRLSLGDDRRTVLRRRHLQNVEPLREAGVHGIQLPLQLRSELLLRHQGQP
jgi:hypothetical protein